MYAVFEDGSRQYRVSKGDVVSIDLRDAGQGDQIELNRILLYANGDNTQIGQPVVEGARVLADVVGQSSEKHVIQKFRRRKNSRRRTGHRQKHLKVLIRHILLAGEEPVEEPEEKVTSEAPQTESPEVKEESSAVTEEQTEVNETSEAPEEKSEEVTQESGTSESEQEEAEEKSEASGKEEEKKD